MLYTKHNPVLFDARWRALFYGDCPHVLYVNDKPAGLEYREDSWWVTIPKESGSVSRFREPHADKVRQILHEAKDMYKLEFRPKPTPEAEENT